MKVKLFYSVSVSRSTGETVTRSLFCFAVALNTILAGQIVQAAAPPQFLGKWIVSTSIRGMASDTQGNIYATDPVNNRVLVFNGDGQLILQWGSAGSADGQFQGVDGIAVGPSGLVYVADYGNSRVQIFDSDGGFRQRWEFPVDETGQPGNPNDVALDTQGNVYVAHAIAYYRIKVYDSNGNLLRQFAPAGTPGISWAPRIAVDRYGYIFAGSAAVVKFDPQGNSIWQVTQIPPFDGSWTPWGPCGGSIGIPSDIIVDPSNNASNNLFMSLRGFCNFVYNVGPEMEFITRIGCVDNIKPDNPWHCMDPDGSGPFVVGDGKLVLPAFVWVKGPEGTWVYARAHARPRALRQDLGNPATLARL